MVQADDVRSSKAATLSRRGFLAAAAITGVAMTACSRPVSASATTRRGFIDVHHHFTAPTGYVAPGSAPWSAEAAIEEMDRGGVATGIGFLGPIVPGYGDVEENRRRAREWNEFGAGVCREHPARFGLFAALPLADTDGALAEMAHAFDELEADGLGLVTNYGNRWLGDQQFDPVWQEANRRSAVVYVHPTDAPCCTPETLSYMTDPVSGPWIEWPMNTARTIMSLMLSGTFRKYPDIRFIFSHGGGVMPLLVERVDGLTGWFGLGPEPLAQLFPEGVHTEFARLRFECAQAYAEPNMAALTALVPAENILFGTDYDRFPIAHSVERFERLTLDPDTATAIARGNAVSLFPRLT